MFTFCSDPPPSFFLGGGYKNIYPLHLPYFNTPITLLNMKHDQAKCKDIFVQLVSDGESARKVCKREGMPSFVTMSKWLKEDSDFRDQYRLAMELRAQKIDDDIDDAIIDMRNGDLDAQQARVLIDTYKWRAAKLYPRFYGEKQNIEVEHTVNSFVDELKLAAAQIEARKLARDKTIDGTATVAPPPFD